MKGQNIWKFSIENFPQYEKIWPCRVSIPVPEDFKISTFSIVRPDGSIVPTQQRTLIKYASGMPRWIQLDFEGNGNGKYIVKNSPVDQKENQFLKIRKTSEGFQVQAGKLHVEISKSHRFPISAIHFKNHQLTSRDLNWRFSAVQGDKQFEIRIDIDSFNIESEGPNRFQLSWLGTLIDTKSNEKILDVRCRIEFLGGIEGFSFSFHVFHCLAKKEFLNINLLGCQFFFPLLDKILLCQQSYGNFAQKRIVEIQKEIEIFLDKTNFNPYVKDPFVLADNFDYPLFLRDYNHIVGSVVCLKNESVSVCAGMRDFIHHRPKRIKLSKGNITFDLWPEFAGILNLQQGTSYRALFDFRFSDDLEQTKKFLQNPDQICIEPVYGWLDESSLHYAGSTFHKPYLSGKNSGIFSWLLSSGTSRFHTVSQMFHYGDTIDDGYTQYYFSQSRFPKKLPKTGMLFNTSGGVYFIPPGLEPVWSNNEYDAIYCLALETIRTRNVSVFKRLIAAARHQIEVDFVHYSDHWQQHRSTPQHSYAHTAMMSSLPSHQWTQGLYHYYVLTGDDDTIDVIKGICDFNMSYFDRIPVRFNNFFNREYGWAILALVYGFEATGNVPYITKAENMIKELEKNTTLQDARKYFGTGFAPNTVLLGLMAFHQATKKPWAKKLFLKWVDYGLKNFADKNLGPRITELFVEPLTYAYYLTGEKKYLLASFWHFELFFKRWKDLGWLSAWPLDMDIMSTKKFSRVYRALIHFFCACKDAGLLSKLEKIIAK
ncbi:MAG: glycoside hydrolase family 127 protein [Candidatus Omnitrophica bacterium]|nr:glycoside hydrolase family 127 protein [Candidatus Omnitrophota bacterium]